MVELRIYSRFISGVAKFGKYFSFYFVFSFMILPDMLKNSPMLKRPQGAKGLGTGGRGKSAMIRESGKLF